MPIPELNHFDPATLVAVTQQVAQQLNPFDLSSLDIRTSAAMDEGTVSPQSGLICRITPIIITLLFCSPGAR